MKAGKVPAFDRRRASRDLRRATCSGRCREVAHSGAESPTASAGVSGRDGSLGAAIAREWGGSGRRSRAVHQARDTGVVGAVDATIETAVEFANASNRARMTIVIVVAADRRSDRRGGRRGGGRGRGYRRDRS